MKPSVKRLGTGRPTKYSEEVILRLCEARIVIDVVLQLKDEHLARWTSDSRQQHHRAETRFFERDDWRDDRSLAVTEESEVRAVDLGARAQIGEPRSNVFGKVGAQAEWLRLTFPEDYRGGQKVEVQQAVQVQVTAEQLEDLRRRLPAARALFGASATLRTESELPEKENEDEVDSPEKAEPAPCSPATTAVQVNYAGLPMQPGDFGYGGKP